jgi:uncharacterized delta-60 repeat protein
MRLPAMVIALFFLTVCMCTVSNGQCLNDYDCGFCEKCQAETCVFQTNVEDTKNECSETECHTGFCNASGACGVSPAGTVCTDDGYTYTDDECDGNGTCVYFLNQWIRIFSGDGLDFGQSIRQTLDGGYIVAGYTSSFDSQNFDIWLLKLSRTGEVVWEKTLGGYGIDYAYAVEQTTDEGFIIAGYSRSFNGGGDADFIVVKLLYDGSLSWQKTYGGIDFDAARSIRQISGGGYIVAGITQSFDTGTDDIWIMKLDPLGELVWEKGFGGNCAYQAYSVLESTDGGYIVAGHVHSCDLANRDVLVLRFDTNGDLLWRKNYGGSSSEYAHSINHAADGGYIIAGRSRSFGDSTSNTDAWVLKLESDGVIAWQKTFGGDLFDRAYSAQQASDGGYIVAGATQSFGAGGDDMWLLKLDSSGGLEWQKAYGGTDQDIAYSVMQTWDDGYVVAGRSHSFQGGDDGIMVLKLDRQGEVSLCGSVVNSSATSSDTSISGGFDISPQLYTGSPAITDVSVTEQSSTTGITDVCHFNPEDIDGDGIYNTEDNCPLHPNPLQEDTYPPQGNGKGDACDCEGNFNCDEDCDGTDATIFKEHFGRGEFTNPCTEELQCLGDFDCDQDCDGSDALLFKADFGRSQFTNSCPPCTAIDWCSY